MNNLVDVLFFPQFIEGGNEVNKLVQILNECGIEESDVAEMLYAYLTEYGEDQDNDLIVAIYQGYFKKEEIK